MKAILMTMRGWSQSARTRCAVTLKHAWGAATLFAALIPVVHAVAADAALTPEASAAKMAAEQVMTAKIEWRGPSSSPKPLAGKRIAVVSCCEAADGAARASRAMVEAGKALGWQVNVLDGRGDPQEQNKALNSAIDAKYDGIVLEFVDTTTVSDGVARAVKAKIPLITLGTLKNTPDTIPDVSWDYARHGEALANYMIWKSNGNVNALILLNTDLYVTRNGQWVGTKNVLTDPKKCKNCKVTVKEWPMANIDTQPGSIATAALQANPKINWGWCFDACMSRVSRALIASGLSSKMRGAGFDCNAESLQLIKDGQVEAVCAADPREWDAYAVIDNLNRLMRGQPTVNQGIPVRLFDKTNISTLSDYEMSHGWQGGYDFRAAYRKLWGVQK
ncbi:sugar ABC transporter substrate-binding protein [Trinickia sp. EG282A]|uniref:sugar ABC transporter substrate-binding protein n=1 Tax=Trinickia sp. EG282A TaxID=3237013 RepID=UPI0034D1FA53